MVSTSCYFEAILLTFVQYSAAPVYVPPVYYPPMYPPAPGYPPAPPVYN